MNPKDKASQLKNHFKVQCSLNDNFEQTRAARAYINQLFNEIPMKDGNYNIGYKHEFYQYTSYWLAVLKEL